MEHSRSQQDPVQSDVPVTAPGSVGWSHHPHCRVFHRDTPEADLTVLPPPDQGDLSSPEIAPSRPRLLPPPRLPPNVASDINTLAFRPPSISAPRIDPNWTSTVRRACCAPDTRSNPPTAVWQVPVRSCRALPRRGGLSLAGRDTCSNGNVVHQPRATSISTYFYSVLRYAALPLRCPLEIDASPRVRSSDNFPATLQGTGSSSAP